MDPLVRLSALRKGGCEQWFGMIIFSSNLTLLTAVQKVGDVSIHVRPPVLLEQSHFGFEHSFMP
jgi:hypothetical protein